MGDQPKDAWTPEQQTQELKKRLGIMLQVANFEKSSFKPNPDDVLIVVPPKNGNTWLTHICHQIRMKGQEPDFKEQLEVLYVLEISGMVTGVAPDVYQQPAKPRLFATHVPYPLLPEGGKQIFCFRNQKDAVVSAYYFMDSQLILKGRVSLPNFALVYLEDVEKHLNELVTWWEHRNDENVLLVFFDDLKEDHAGSVRRIAKFMGVECDEDTIARVVHTTTHAEMSRHSSKFNMGDSISMMSKQVGEEPDPDNEYVGRVRKDGGKLGEGKEKLPLEIQQKIDQLWQQIVTTKLGFKDLDEMRAALKKK